MSLARLLPDHPALPLQALGGHDVLPQGKSVAAAQAAPPAPAAPFRIRLLGTFAVEHEGTDITAAMPGQKGRRALAYLAANHPHGVTREDLVDVIWPDVQPADPRANLRTLLSRIRDALSPQVLTDGPVLRLTLECVDVDVVDALEDAAVARTARTERDARMAVHHARAALAVLDQPLLGGFDGEWVDALWRTVDETSTEMLACIADMGSLAGGALYDDAIAAGRVLADQDGNVERGHAHLMLALARAGEPGEALRVYDQALRRLRADHGSSPGPELRDLHAAILNGRPITPVQARDTTSDDLRLPLPMPVLASGMRPFHGREQDLEQILGAGGCDPRSRLAVVTGSPGSGKSHLVSRAAVLASERGRVVLFARCPENPAVAFQPITDVLAHLLHVLPPSVGSGLLDQLHDDLAPVLHDLRPACMIPDLDEGGLALFRLLEAVSSMLRRLAVVSPVMLVVDDLQNADLSTRLLVRHLEGSTRDLPITMLLTCQDHAYDAADGAGELLGEILRERPITVVRLEAADTACRAV